ncbi:hypothetical protein IDH44_21055 [Paenibacillus sp. IB182496]|uniref:Uncharacterized protein n=1 Tax=Paenibacillus sabuli TaxID=2772509 RepID=A0A927BYK8_9BACL|nr:hypothetical protein [Paenibacillus sabuli]MBD2847688.1 hypothetical protein [Paenibacillus sabuli]
MKERTAVNKILVDTQTTKYVDVEHPVIVLDGVPLDAYLHHLYPNNLYLGLVPTISEWLGSREEAKLILSRFYSEENKIALPILMCPDDCDLLCTVIIAEVTKTDSEVIWSRVGEDASQLDVPYNYERIGTEVNWLEKVPEMKFYKYKYYENLENIYK